jgi:uncharacterized protein
MHVPHDAVLLRIFIGESDRYEHQPLYQAIVLKARELQLAGATVLRGPMGFGKSSHLHTAKILRLSMDLPMVIEIVDSEEKVNAFLPVLDKMNGRRPCHPRTGESDPVSRPGEKLVKNQLACHIICRSSLDGVCSRRRFDPNCDTL